MPRVYASAAFGMLPFLRLYVSPCRRYADDDAARYFDARLRRFASVSFRLFSLRFAGAPAFSAPLFRY